jgi:polar amino acid transport system substrate-binding protein
MLRSHRLIALALVVAALAVLAACGDDDDDDGGGASTEPAATEQADACAKDQLALKNPGQLTIGTDKPAFPPYFVDDDPTNGKGFESAVAYAVADELGFTKDEVEWTVVPFNASYAPGPKDFDFVQIGTTSLDAVNQVMQPAEDPKVFNDSNDVVTALKQGQVDAVVVDLPTAFYVTAAQVPNSRIVGQFSAPGGDSFGLLLEKDSELTECVDQAIAALEESGRLEQITNKWMGAAAGAPELR